jgi:hypothetical protein
LIAPSGYERLLVGHAVAIARADLAVGVRQALIKADGTRSTLHEYAARHPAARRLSGRGAAFAVPLPSGGPDVVVRHNRHGGLFGPLTRDLFFSPTRAPYELQVSLELSRLGIATPEVVAYALYPPGGVLQRSDVCTREIRGGRDLVDILESDHGEQRAAAMSATAQLVAQLARACARHADLNAKNVLVVPGDPKRAWVLDVDRVTISGQPDSALEGNLARLARSLRKWRDRFGVSVSETEIDELASAARRTLQRGD